MGKIWGAILARAFADPSSPSIGGFPAENLGRYSVDAARAWLWAVLGFMAVATCLIALNLYLGREGRSEIHRN